MRRWEVDCPRRLPWAVIGDRRHAPFLVVHGAPTSHGPEPSSPLRSARQASLRQFLVPAPQQPLLLPTHSDRPPGSRQPEPSSSHPSHPDILQTHNAATTTPNTHPHRQSRLRRYTGVTPGAASRNLGCMSSPVADGREAQSPSANGWRRVWEGASDVSSRH